MRGGKVDCENQIFRLKDVLIFLFVVIFIKVFYFVNVIIKSKKMFPQINYLFLGTEDENNQFL